MMKRFLATVALINLSIFSIAQKNPLPPGKGYVVYYNQAESLYGKAKRLSGVEDEDGKIQKLQDQLYKQALIKYQQAVSIASKAKNDSLCFGAFIKIALIYHFFDSVNAAKENYLKAIALKQRLPQVRDSFLFKPYLFLGALFYQENEFDSAFAYYQKAQQIQDNYKIPLEESQRLYNKQGALYYETGNYRLAKTYFEKALSLLSPFDASYLSLMINYKINIASIAIKLEQYDEAKKIYESLLPFKIYENEIWHNMGIIDIHLQKYKEAIENLKKVRYSNTRVIDLDYNLALAFDHLNHMDSVQYYLRHASEKNTELNGTQKNTPWGLILKLQADKELQLKKFPEALHYYQQAIMQFDVLFNDNDIYKNPEQFSGIFSYINLFYALIAKAEALEQFYYLTKDQKKLIASFDAFHAAFKLADYVEKTYESDESRLFLNKIKYSEHSKPIDVCLNLYKLTQDKYYLEQAYLFDQQNKASILALNLQLSVLQKQAGASSGILKEFGRLKSEITRLSFKASRTADNDQLQEINKQVSNYEIRLAQLQQLLNNDPKYSQLKPAERIPSISLLQSNILDKKTVLVSYHLSEKEVVIFVITKSEFTYYRQSIDKRFFDDINLYLKYLHGVNISDQEGESLVSKHLYQVLIQPITSVINHYERLIIIPDDELNYIPFEALKDENNDYLLKSFSVQYQYSSSLINSKSEKEPAPFGKILGFAPFTNDDPQNQFDVLKYSKNELEGFTGKIFLGKNATKQNFLANANHYKIIHLATHANADDQSPMHSSIAFFPSGEDSAYLLYAQEIYNLNLDSTQLIILSACETGTGQLVRGEGLMSLSRAFAYAGCPNIITSLWKAEDKTTAFLAKRIHFYLQRNYPKDEALQKAKLDLLNSKEIAPQFKTPRFWAHIVFIGNYQPQRSSHVAAWIGVISFLVFICLFLLKKKTWPKKAAR